MKKNIFFILFILTLIHTSFSTEKTNRVTFIKKEIAGITNAQDPNLVDVLHKLSGVQKARDKGLIRGVITRSKKSLAKKQAEVGYEKTEQ